MAESIVSFVLENLSQQLAHEAKLLWGVEDKVNSLCGELRMLNAFLKYAERKKIRNEIFDEVVDQIKDVVHESEDVIDTFIARVTKHRRRNILGRAIHSAGHGMMLYRVAGKVKMLKNRINEINSNKIRYDVKDIECTTAVEDNLRRELINRQRRNVEEDDVVGFFHDSSLVIQQLMKGGSHSRFTVVSIIGMGGLGKTTLARKIYNNNQVKNYFDCRAWVYVSNDYRSRELLLSLFKCFVPISEDEYSSSEKSTSNSKSQNVHSLSENKLKNEVRESLIGKRYLVVLDDIWKTQDWDEIRDIFPDDGVGSRVLITSRLKEMASHTGRTPPYYLPFLSAEESWELFSKKVFRGEDCPSDLEPMGRKIAESCDGLPLSIVVLSGLLANKEKSLREWSKIMGHVNWYLTQDETQVKDIVLKLSYDSLPRRLKSCFLYFGVFPEDFEVRVRSLIQKWVAEGFIQESGTRNPEDVAEDYLYELVDRSLIQVASWGSDGGLKTCRIHDLLRDLCISEGEKDKFFEVCTDASILTRTGTKPRRLSVHCSTPSFVSSSNCDHSCTRSLFCFSENYEFTSEDWKLLVKGFKLARVLDIGKGWPVYPPSIVSKLEALIHLRYLRLDYSKGFPPKFIRPWFLSRFAGCADLFWPVRFDRTAQMKSADSSSEPSNQIELRRGDLLNQQIFTILQGSQITLIPDSICNLWNLETLDLGSRHSRTCIFFPSGIWKLKRLRHIHTAAPLILSGFSGPNAKIMGNLQTLSIVALNKETASLIEKGIFPSLRKLGLFIMSNNDWEGRQLLHSLKHLTSLGTLKILPDYRVDGRREICRRPSLFRLSADSYPSSITKITWRNIAGLCVDSMKTLANLTNLQILKICGQYSPNEDCLPSSPFGASFPCGHDIPFELLLFSGWFPQLQVFHMTHFGVQNWKLANGAMPRLRCLVINNCKYLFSLPNELWTLTTLRHVQVLRPSRDLGLMLQNLQMKDGVELIIQ